MTITIHNISKLLGIINLVKKGNKSNSSKVKIGFEQKGIVEGVNYSFFEEISDFCELVSLIEIDDEDYIITELGNKFLENTDSLDSKRNFLILNCVMNGKLSEIILPIIYDFNSNNKSLWCDMLETYTRFKNHSKFLSLLYELNFLERNWDDETVEVNTEIRNTRIFQEQVNERVRIPLSKQEKDRKRQDEENKITGETAEEIVVKFEKKRLESEKYFKEAEKVQQISVDFSNAGYDIESFVGKAENLERPDKFIEVKGTTTEEFRFFWSKNEIKQAQKLGNRYWIYFVANVNKDDGSGEIIEMISDPFSKIDPFNHFNRDEYHKECESFKITKKTEEN